MKKIINLNQELAATNEEVEIMITELAEREEFACTGNACGADACGVN